MALENKLPSSHPSTTSSWASLVCACLRHGRPCPCASLSRLMIPWVYCQVNTTLLACEWRHRNRDVWWLTRHVSGLSFYHSLPGGGRGTWCGKETAEARWDPLHVSWWELEESGAMVLRVGSIDEQRDLREINDCSLWKHYSWPFIAECSSTVKKNRHGNSFYKRNSFVTLFKSISLCKNSSNQCWALNIDLTNRRLNVTSLLFFYGPLKASRAAVWWLYCNSS